MLRPQSLPLAMPDEQRAVAVFQRLARRDFVRRGVSSRQHAPGARLPEPVRAAPAQPVRGDDGLLDDLVVERLEFMYPSHRDDDVWFFGGPTS